jgi:mRNA-degrading endonuclease RelE of RelBE toxin-antitoxin system
LRLPHRAATVAARVDIQYTTLALTDLRLLPPRFADQIIRKIERLRVGLVGDVKALTNAEAGYRLRSGDFRVLFDSDGKTVVIRRVLNRRDAYR